MVDLYSLYIENCRMNPVIVSAFMTDVNQRNDRDLSKYIQYGNELIHACAISGTDMVLFLEKHVFDLYFSSLGGDQWVFLYSKNVVDIRIGGMGGGGVGGSEGEGFGEDSSVLYNCHCYSIGLCRCFFVFYEWKNMYLLSKEHLATEFSVGSTNPHKDTFRYMVVQCNKTEWMRVATIVYPSGVKSWRSGDNIAGDVEVGSNKNVFAWIDFGIFHMFPSPRIFQSRFFAFLQKMSLRTSVCFASCWNPFIPLNGIDLYKTITWVFAGSVFYGEGELLCDLAGKMREKCLQIIETKKTLMWEVNVWYLIFQENPSLFSFYHCDHNQSVFG